MEHYAVMFLNQNIIPARVFIPYYVGQIVADVMHQARGEESHLFQHVAFLSGLTVVRWVTALNQTAFTSAASFSPASGAVCSHRPPRWSTVPCAATCSTRWCTKIWPSSTSNSPVTTKTAVYNKPAGAILSRLTTDCQTVSGCLGTQVNVFLRNSVMLIGSLVFMFSLSWRLSMITFIAIPPLTLISKYYGSYYDVS